MIPGLFVDGVMRPRLLMPATPYLRRITDLVVDGAPMSLMISRIWNTNRRPLCWVFFRPALDEDTTVQRITGWSYQAGHGGFVAGALYPRKLETRTAVDAWRRDDPDAVVKPLQNGAQVVGDECHRMGIATVVLATGDLDENAAADLSVWLQVFRKASGRRTTFVAIGLTLNGWPLAPAISGRSRPPETVTFTPWQFPAGPKRPFYTKKEVYDDDTGKNRAKRA